MPKMPRICLKCGREFEIWPYEKERAKYCSKKCLNQSQKGKHSHPETEFKPGEPGPWLGKKRPEIKNWLTPFPKGNIPWNKGIPHIYRGEKHWNWKGGITPLRKKLHGTYQYRQWRLTVLKRDNYTCQICGESGREADHIKRWKEYPELRHEISNGRTLCHDCHKQTDTYGNKNYKSTTA